MSEPDAPAGDGAPTRRAAPAMPPVLAATVVFCASAAVLVLEILAGRLLAPYVGVSLETYTAVIGTMLAGIAGGAWAGGYAADRIDPRRLLGPLVVVGGALSILTVPVVRWLGALSDTGGPTATTLLAIAGFFLPAAVLSAVTPAVVKLQLHDLGATGGVVGRLSAVGTAGALVGTFVTGFVLVAEFPTRGTIMVLGGVLVVGGVALWTWQSRRDVGVLLAALAVAAGGGALAAFSSRPCEVESAYYCLRVDRDPGRASGRILWLDDLRHSYVDLADPTFLEFDYTRSVADTIAAVHPGDGPIDAAFVGGGGFTLPRYVEATRPGSTSVVFEIDRAVPRLARAELGLRTSPQLRVVLGDARLSVRDVADGSYDVVVGDAFGSLSVPWHLTTREFLADVHRILRPDGIYVMNVIDYEPFRFARAELATLREQFATVALIGSEASLAGTGGGNVVLVASRAPLGAATLADLARRAGRHDDLVLTGADLDRYVAGAPVLTDDHAPVDQWLATSGRGA